LETRLGAEILDDHGFAGNQRVAGRRSLSASIAPSRPSPASTPRRLASTGSCLPRELEDPAQIHFQSLGDQQDCLVEKGGAIGAGESELPQRGDGVCCSARFRDRCSACSCSLTRRSRLSAMSSKDRASTPISPGAPVMPVRRSGRRSRAVEPLPPGGAREERNVHLQTRRGQRQQPMTKPVQGNLVK